MVYSESLLPIGVLCVFGCSVCLFLYGPDCHGVPKLDLSSLFKKIFLGTSIQFIFQFHNSVKTYKSYLSFDWQF